MSQRRLLSLAGRLAATQSALTFSKTETTGQKTSAPSFVDIAASKLKAKNTTLKRIGESIDWDSIRTALEKAHVWENEETGRDVLFRIELLRKWYRLSDMGVANAVGDRISFNVFAGLTLDGAVPDSETIRRFRNTLAEAGIYDTLMSNVGQQLKAHGMTVKQGKMVEVSLVPRHRTYILRWNPDISSFKSETYAEALRETHGHFYFNWSVYEWEYAAMGDRFFMMRVGGGNAGIVFDGYFKSDPYIDDDWSNQGKIRRYVDIECVNAVEIDRPTLTLEELSAAIPDINGDMATLVSC